MAGSVFVLFSYFYFPKLRKLRHLEVVMYVTANDLIAGVGCCLGRASNGTFACYFQSFSTNYNYLSSIFWTVVITFQLFYIIQRGKFITINWYTHAFCWGFPLIVTMLPLSTNTFGNPDDESDWCFFGNGPNSPSWYVLKSLHKGTQCIDITYKCILFLTGLFLMKGSDRLGLAGFLCLGVAVYPCVYNHVRRDVNRG